MKNSFLNAQNKAKVVEEFKAYTVIWQCNQGHKNHQTILSKGSQHDVCLKCGKPYSYELE